MATRGRVQDPKKILATTVGYLAKEHGQKGKEEQSALSDAQVLARGFPERL